MERIKIGFAPKTIELPDGTFLHFWYANNKGRGSNNCTIIRSLTEERAAMSRNQTGIIASESTGSWSGNVNFSKAVQEHLGLLDYETVERLSDGYNDPGFYF